MPNGRRVAPAWKSSRSCSAAAITERWWATACTCSKLGPTWMFIVRCSCVLGLQRIATPGGHRRDLALRDTDRNSTSPAPYQPVAHDRRHVGGETQEGRGRLDPGLP